MMANNPTGEDLDIANTNWLLIERLSKAGGIANTAIQLLGLAKNATAANKVLVKACKDISQIVNLEQLKAGAK